MNFVFFFPDQQRAESLSCYGHPLVEMPNYDRLASEGVRFEQCHTQAVLCTPARCSLMTGWYPHVMGHRTLWHLLRSHEPSMFRYLKEAGYQVVVYGKNDVFSVEYLNLALDEYESKPGGNSGPNPFDMDDPRYYSFMVDPFPGEPEETGDMRCVQAGIDFIKSRKKEDRPFMLFLPLTLPHPAYGPPQPYYDMYNPDDIPPLRQVNDEGVPEFRKLMRQYRRLDQLPEGFFCKINAIYLGMNSYVDWMLGQLLDAIDESEIKEDTTFILAADHGDLAGDYGLVEKIHNAHYDVLTRVPLIIRTPGGSAGHVVEEQVELFDIMPTVLELAGIEARHTHFARSLVPQLNGAKGDPERAVFIENGFNTWEPHCFEGHSPNCGTWDKRGLYYPQTKQHQEIPQSMSRTTTIRTLDAKLTRRPDDLHELYDLKSDPFETKNVYNDPEYRNIRDELNMRMLDWYIRTSDVVPFDDDPRGFPEVK